MSRFFSLLLLPFKWIHKAIHIIRITLANVVFIGILLLFGAAFFYETDTSIPPKSILKISIEGNLVEERSLPTSLLSFASDYLGETKKSETLVQDIVTALDAAKDDPNIVLIQMDTSKMNTAAYDTLKLIGDKINSFQESGKKVVFLQDNFLQQQYYLASFGDEIGINSMGFIGLTGFANYKLYFKQVLDTLRIDYNVFVVGDYKSALEPFTRTSMSDEDREQTKLWLDGLWSEVSSTIETERGLDKDTLYNYTHNSSSLLRKAGGSSAQMAKDSGLVDHIFTRNQMSLHLQKLSNNSTNVVSLNNYLSSLPSPETTAPDRIGIIIAEGNIVPGTQPPGTIGADNIIKAIRKAKETPSIKGLVLRVNSGGGSAYASELIRQELLEFKESGKPLFISMGRLAASGAYWISADADEIWASPTTITGSIGIFGAIPTFQRSLSSIGIYSDGVTNSPVAGATNLSRAISSEARDLMQQSVEYGYNQFLSIVSTGRNMVMEDVQRIAQGKVYIGKTAQEIGLVDQVGTLADATNALASQLNLTEFDTVYIEKEQGLRQQILKAFTSSSLHSLFESYIGAQTYDFIQEEGGDFELFMNSPDPMGIYSYSGQYRL